MFAVTNSLAYVSKLRIADVIAKLAVMSQACSYQLYEDGLPKFTQLVIDIEKYWNRQNPGRLFWYPNHQPLVRPVAQDEEQKLNEIVRLDPANTLRGKKSELIATPEETRRQIYDELVTQVIELSEDPES